MTLIFSTLEQYNLHKFTCDSITDKLKVSNEYVRQLRKKCSCLFLTEQSVICSKCDIKSTTAVNVELMLSPSKWFYIVLMDNMKLHISDEMTVDVT